MVCAMGSALGYFIGSSVWLLGACSDGTRGAELGDDIFLGKSLPELATVCKGRVELLGIFPQDFINKYRTA